jgi:hypothetical protein
MMGFSNQGIAICVPSLYTSSPMPPILEYFNSTMASFHYSLDLKILPLYKEEFKDASTIPPPINNPANPKPAGPPDPFKKLVTCLAAI